MNFHKPLILAYRALATRVSRLGFGRPLVALALAGGAVAAFGLVPDDEPERAPVTSIVRDLDLPALAAREPAVYWQDARVARGDTIGALLARAGVDDADAFEFLRSDPSARALYQLRPGRALRVATDDQGDLVELRFLQPGGEMLTVTRDGDRFVASSAAPATDVRIEMKTGEIRSSLFAAADQADMPDAVTIALTEIFGGDIDFHHDLRRGDSFAVVYERRSVEGEPVGTGRILAAEFVNKGVARRAYLWTDPEGHAGYYGDDGRSTRRAFTRAPLSFSRVSSGFTTARLHPIQKIWKAHTGTDFAAPMGTPVHATADGSIAFAGQQRGYGNVVIVRHGGSLQTVYAHLSRFAPKLAAGAHVSQGDVIGFVGMTGWATGPHLHYEFRVDGKPRNPLTVALPTAQPVPEAERARFAAEVAPEIEALALARSLAVETVAAAQ